MKLLKFSKYVPVTPVTGQGIPEGHTLLVTDHLFKALQGMKLHDGVKFEEAVGPDLLPQYESRIYRGQELKGTERMAFYYPGGIGDACAQTAIVRSFKGRQPDLKFRVWAGPKTAPVWFNNPDLESKCARPDPPTLDSLLECDYWLLGDGLLYWNTDPLQPNMYEQFAQNFHVVIPLECRRPFLYVSEDEANSLYLKLNSWMGREMEDEALCLFNPFASKVNREWPERHWAELVNRIRKNMRYHVIAVGEGKHAQALGRLVKATGCGAIAGGLTPRELIVLANEADRIVTVDSALSHIGPGLGVPTVCLYGAFSPEMRCSTYKYAESVFPQSACPKAPCCWHDDLLPAWCPAVPKGASECLVMDAITPDAVMRVLAEWDPAAPPRVTLPGGGRVHMPATNKGPTKT